MVDKKNAAHTIYSFNLVNSINPIISTLQYSNPPTPLCDIYIIE